MNPTDDNSVEVGGKDDRLLSWDQVKRIASISRSTAWRMERDGAFPRRVRVSPGRVGWWESELTMWKRSRTGQTPPPPRKAARAPRLPGMPRPMPRPGQAVEKPVIQTAPSGAARPKPMRTNRRKPTVTANQIDFGF